MVLPLDALRKRLCERFVLALGVPPRPFLFCYSMRG